MVQPTMRATTLPAEIPRGRYLLDGATYAEVRYVDGRAFLRCHALDTPILVCNEKKEGAWEISYHIGNSRVTGTLTQPKTS